MKLYVGPEAVSFMVSDTVPGMLVAPFGHRIVLQPYCKSVFA